jgi:hypothetical protein
MTKPVIVLVEDDVVRAKLFLDALKTAAGSRFRVRTLALPAEAAHAKTYEDQIFDLLRDASASLVVTDRDLSRLKPFYGLSERAVSGAALRLGLPVCMYASGHDSALLEWRRSGGTGRILIESTMPQILATRVAVIADGFERLQKSLGVKAPKKFQGPGPALAAILKAPEAAERFRLFSRGDPAAFSLLHPTDMDGTRPTKRDAKTQALFLGVWLYESIMRFPGILVNDVAAASFLNIAQSQWQKSDVRKLFSAALYEGPFADDARPFWWRHRLEDVLTSHDQATGKDYATVKLKRSIAPCGCHKDGVAPAGYVCVFTGKPICADHSIGPIAWVPRGADLARADKAIAAEIGPWMGLS